MTKVSHPFSVCFIAVLASLGITALLLLHIWNSTSDMVLQQDKVDISLHSNKYDENDENRGHPDLAEGLNEELERMERDGPNIYAAKEDHPLLVKGINEELKMEKGEGRDEINNYAENEEEHPDLLEGINEEFEMMEKAGGGGRDGPSHYAAKGDLGELKVKKGRK